MTAVARSWRTTGIAVVVVALLLASMVYLVETITGPRQVPVDYTPDTTPRAAP